MGTCSLVIASAGNGGMLIIYTSIFLLRRALRLSESVLVSLPSAEVPPISGHSFQRSTMAKIFFLAMIFVSMLYRPHRGTRDFNAE